MFENLIKITRSTSDPRSQIKFPAFSDNFLSVKEITSDNLNQFLDTLKSFNEKLDDFLAELYKSEENNNIQKEYDKVVSKLNKKQSKIKYLLSYFETLQLKIEVFQKQLDEKEAALKKLEDKKIAIQSKLINLKKDMKSTELKPINRLLMPTMSGPTCQIFSEAQNENEDITLSLSTTNDTSIDDDLDQYSDWSDLE